MKKVLILTYYWPPSGGPGVQRWMKFVKFLPDNGFQPVVITVDPVKASYPVTDLSLVAEVPVNTAVHLTGTSEPYNLYKAFTGRKTIPHGGFAGESEPSFLQKIARSVRGNLFIPDARIGWNKYALKEAEKLLNKQDIAAIVTTSPPHSTQLAGLTLKKKFNIPWIADLRDPWTDIYFYRYFYHLPWARKKDARLEKTVIDYADKVIVVSEDMKKMFLKKSIYLNPDKIKVIPNGYDEEDFALQAEPKKDHLLLTYTGTLSPDYDIRALIQALVKLQRKYPSIPFRFRIIGHVSDQWIRAIRKQGLEPVLDLIPYQPHQDVIRYMKESHTLLLVIPKVDNNRGIVTGKLFEYLAARRPILCIGPEEGDAAHIIERCQAGETVGYEKTDRIVFFFESLIEQWKAKNPMEVKSQIYQKYERKELTRLLADTINRILPAQ